jgi:hypothetical protein
MSARMKPYLIDGPIMEASDRRKAMIERMAKDLVESGEGLLCDSDAMQALRRKGYPMVDAVMLAPEARMVAFQGVVATEMMDNET